MLAIEGAAKSTFPRFRILIPQVTLELRKVELYEQVQKLSIIDGLTETYLRRYLMTRLEEEVDRARRLGLTFSIGMVDIDFFKECNDKYGHLVGDAVLKKVAQRLKNSVREVDMIARYGGEEFCIVLPETTKNFAKTVAERLRESVESEEIKAFDEKMRMTVSVGISGYPEDGLDAATLIDKADTALYKAKRKGRNTVHVL
jgi:diguanylate cyclase (GGDEF)-like protein